MTLTARGVVTIQYCREYHIEIEAARAKVQGLGQVKQQCEK